VARSVVRRAARLLATLWAVTFLSFLLITLLPGDPALQIIGPQYATDERLAQVREELGFTDPIHVRYADWIVNAAQGDLGQSYRSGQPVATALVDRIPVSIELILIAQLVAVGAALVLAPIAAYRTGGVVDRFSSAMTSASLSVPPFVIGLGLIFVFAVQFAVVPATGFVEIGSSFIGHVRSLALPALTLAAVPFALYFHALRGEVTTAMGQDFILLARSKGVSTAQLLLRHALRPSVLPLITLVGINMGALIGGAVIVEKVFSLPGVGRLLVDSITGRDYLMVQGIVAFVTVAYVLANALVDMVYAAVDPRIRSGHEGA
jgi:peptide/nickel transport system permease protein